MPRRELWLQCRSGADPSRMRLFCLPHAGGGASAFHSWNRSLPSFVQVCSICLPGRERRGGEPLAVRMDEVIEAMEPDLADWLDLPYAVFGHSMGALLAFEWVRRIEEYGGSMPAWLFLSGRRAPSVESRIEIDEPSLHALSDARFLEELTRRYQGIPEEMLRDAEMLQYFLPILRADIAIVESYRYREAGPLNCPITAFAGAEDTSVTWDQMMAWSSHTRQRFALQLFPGGHFYPQQPLLAAISSTLATLAL